MSKAFVWTCDYCLSAAEVESEDFVPLGFQIFRVEGRTTYRTQKFEITMCEKCFEKSVDPGPKSLFRRLLTKMKVLK